MTLALPYLSRPTTINKRIQIEKKKKAKIQKKNNLTSIYNHQVVLI